MTGSSVIRNFWQGAVDWVASYVSVEGKMRDNAKNWIELAEKIHHYRRDVIPEVLAAELQSQIGNLKLLLRERSNAAKLKLGIEELEGVLRRTGGHFYPRSTVQEYVEFFLVAAIVVLGIRTYFVQPFKIPTNSMWPSYNGMTPCVYANRGSEPGLASEGFRFLAFGASPYRYDAPADGEIIFQAAISDGRVIVPYREVDGRKWGVVPTRLKEYRLYVGEETVFVRVPLDFDFEWVLRDAYFPNATPSHEPSGVDLARVYSAQRDKIHDGLYQLIRTGRTVRKGDRILAFDIVTGDQLFVDRFSYNFVRPTPGSAFVFRTDNIHSEYMLDRSGRQVEAYYIKRLVGLPGDRIEIRQPVLLRNGEPIKGADAFDKNARREGEFSGYRNLKSLAPGCVLEIPQDGFLALGDNSANSLDGRYWGFVPRKDAVGRPLFVYYPFGAHWGSAK